MARQDDWVRITLRLPPELHNALRRDAQNQSLNAEIVSRLEESYLNPDEDAENKEIFKQQMTNLVQRMTLLIDQLGVGDDSPKAKHRRRMKLRRKAAAGLMADGQENKE